MTIEERFARIEHVTAGLAEERRKDREEFRALWRGTQRQIDALAVQDERLGKRIEILAEESRAADQRLAERIEETDKRLGARIESLVSAMGEFIASQTRS